MTKNKQNELTDSNYVHWMDKEKWSLTEAVYLLHGLVPRDSELTIDQLDDFIKIQPKQRLEARIHALDQKLKKHDQDTGQSKIDLKIVSAYKADLARYEADLKKFPGTVAFLKNLQSVYETPAPGDKELQKIKPKLKYENLRQCPEDWVLQAIKDGMIVIDNDPLVVTDKDRTVLTDCWKAIFIQMINDNFQIHNGKRGYHRFIQVFVSDTKTRLGKLAEWVLNLGENAITNPPADQPMPSEGLVTLFNDLLDDMNTALGLNATDTGELPGKLVRPQKFIKICPPRYFIPPSPCLRWAWWLSDYPTLAAKLKTLGKAKLTNCQISTPDQKAGRQLSKQDDPLVPQGGDRITEKLYNFANEVGIAAINAATFSKSFRAWLAKNHSDFTVEHGSITYLQGNNEWAEVTDKHLKARIYRLRLIFRRPRRAK